MAAPVKNLRDGTITIQVDNDGGGNAGSVAVTLDEGNLEWTEARPVEMISDRGTLSHARRSIEDQLVELTFSLMYTDHLDPNSAVPTVYEALTRQGAAAAWVSQTQDSDDYAVNVEFIVADPAGGNDEEINFDKFNVTNIVFSEGSPNTLVVTGTAPLYWVDFWWRAADGLNPAIGGVGTFARAGTGTYTNGSGEVDYARSGEFRSRHHPSATAGRTGLLEAQRTDTLTMSEDLGGADWAATNITVGVDDNIGPDGYTTAETLTASAGNGTLINDLGVIGATDQVFSIWLKRKTGTGDIDLTLNGGGAWTTVVITSSWARYSITSSLADPDVGIRIVTNADAVYAWGAQVEAATFMSSYIPTTVYPLSPDGYLEFSGAAGNYASTPDAAVLDIVGDIDIRARIAPDDWTPGADQCVLGKWTGAELSYRLRVLTTDKLSLSWTTDGGVGTIVTVTSTAATGFTDGTIHWVRVTLDVSSGNVNFYTSDDGENWTLLGAADQGGAGATSIHSGTALLELGSVNVGTQIPFAGKVYRAQVFASLNGSALAFDADPQDTSTHGVKRIELTEKENSAVVTTFATSAAATRVTDLMFFPLPAAVDTPKEETAYVSFVEKGTTLTGNATGLIYVGSATSGVDPRWGTEISTLKYAVFHDNGTTVPGAILDAGPSLEDAVEIRVSLNADGSVLIGQSLNGAAETTKVDATVAVLAAAWADKRIYVNSLGTSGIGFNAFRELILTRRTRTLEHLRKVG